jgi:hypothetical protein
MREGWKRDVVPVGSREWLDRQRRGQELDWHNVLPEASQTVTDKLDTTFWRVIGRQGRLERSRNFARRNVRAWRRFCRRYGYSPNQVKTARVSASPEQRDRLRAFASRGGQARARKYSREQLRAWAAKGGYAKAAKSKQASSPTQAVAGKQE